MGNDRADMGSNAALMLACCFFAALGLLAFFDGVHPPEATPAGICLPPPQTWQMPPWLSLAINLALVFFSAFLLAITNRSFNFIPSTSVIFASTMVLMACACPRLMVCLNSSTLLLAANAVALRMTFGQYNAVRRNPGNMFVVATIFSLGSMVHYSFLFFIVIYACSAALLKAFRLREFLALLLGVIAPYWIVLGLGLVPVDDVRFPVIGGFWNQPAPGHEMLWLIVATSLTAFVGLMCGLKNAFSLYSAPTAIRAYNFAMTLPAMACIILPMVDWENFTVYYMPICLFAGLEYGYLNAFTRRPKAIRWSRPKPVQHFSTGFLIYWLTAAVYSFISLMSIYNV